MTPLFKDKDGNFITVDKAYGRPGFTFYKKPDLKKRGKRIKPRMELFYQNAQAAVDALTEYGNKRKDWKPLPAPEEDLPYDFDLCYDIKTRAELQAKYIALKTNLKGLEELINAHNIQGVMEGKPCPHCPSYKKLSGYPLCPECGGALKCRE